MRQARQEARQGDGALGGALGDGSCGPHPRVRKNRPQVALDRKNRPLVSLLYGESRHELIKTCIAQVHQYNNDCPDNRAILLVPETSKMDMEYDFMSSTDRQGMMMTEVLSFSRFCYHLLGEIGLNSGDIIDDTGKSMLIYKILKENEDRFVLFKNLCQKTGFISEILSVMGDLKRVLIDAPQLEKASQEMSDPIISQKAKELAILFSEYEIALAKTSLKDPQENYTTTTAQIERLNKMKKNGAVSWPYDRLEWLFKTKIWITGFGETRDFTPQEYAMIEALSRCCEVVITLVCDRTDNTLFRAGRQSMDRFAKNGLSAGAPEYVPADIKINESAKADISINRPAIFLHLEACWKNQIPSPIKENKLYKGDTIDKSDFDEKNAVILIHTATKREEAAILAGEINRLVREENFRYRDISVLAAGIESYKTIISAVFHEAAIPYYMDEKKSIAGTALARMVRNLIDLVLQNWPLKAFMNYARCGLSSVSDQEIDEFETFMLSAGIKWKKQLFDDRRFETDSPENNIQGNIGQDNKMLEIRERLCRSVLKFEQNVRDSTVSSQYCQALRTFLYDEETSVKIKKMSDSLLVKREESSSTALVKAWNELAHLLEQIELIAQDTPIDLHSFRDILINGMAKAFSGTIPSAVDQVHFAPIGQISGRQSPVLFVIGMTENDYPEKIPPEGILKDRDREAFSEYFKINIPSVLTDKYYEDIFSTYSLLSLPERKLYLSCPEPAELESGVITFIRSCVPDCRTIGWKDTPGPDDLQIYSRNNAFYSLLSKLPNKNINPAENGSDRDASYLSDRDTSYSDDRKAFYNSEWNAFYRLIEEMPEFRARLQTLLNMVKSSQAKIFLTKEKIAQRYDNPIAMSISQLEKYNACAFSHFAQYLLKLQPRASRDLQSTDTGSMLHGIVELAVSQFMEEYRTAKDDMEKEDLLRKYRSMDFNEFALAKMKEIVNRDGMGAFLEKGFFASKGRTSYRLAAATLQALFSQIDPHEFVPGISEWEFSAKNKNAISFQTENNMRMLFHGKVDRIDFQDDYFRVIDYKSGNKTVDFDEWYHGLSLQLPAYIAAFCAENPQLLPKDAAYMQFTRPIISYENGAYDIILQKHIANINRKFLLRGTKMEPEELVAASHFTIDKMRKLSGQLLGGQYDIKPKRLKGKESACKFCDYQSFCGFEAKYDNDNILEPLPDMKDAQGKKIAKKDVFSKKLSELKESKSSGLHGVENK